MANLYYYNEKGEKVGPLTPLALQALVLQGEVTPDSTIENDKGQRILAQNLKGLTFPVNVPAIPVPHAESEGKSSFLVTVIGLLIIVAVAWAGLKIEHAYSGDNSLLSLLTKWTGKTTTTPANSSGSEDEPGETTEDIFPPGDKDNGSLDIEELEKQLREENEKARREEEKRQREAEAKAETERRKRELEQKIAAERAERERKEREAQEAEQKRVEEEKAEADRQRKQAERDKILAGATDLWPEVRRCGFEATEWGLKEYVKYGNLSLQKRLEAAQTAYNNLNAFDQQKEGGKGIKAVNDEIAAAKKEIAAKEFVYECFYSTGINDNLKIIEDESSFEMRLMSSLVPSDSRPGVGDGTICVPGVRADYTRWYSIPLCMNFFVHGSTEGIRELYQNSNKYQARVRLKKLQEGNSLCPIAEIIRIDIVKREEEIEKELAEEQEEEYVPSSSPPSKSSAPSSPSRLRRRPTQ